MIDFHEAFSEACFDLMTTSEKQDYIFSESRPSYELRSKAEQYILIRNVTELSKKCKYAI